MVNEQAPFDFGRARECSRDFRACNRRAQRAGRPLPPRFPPSSVPPAGARPPQRGVHLAHENLGKSAPELPIDQLLLRGSAASRESDESSSSESTYPHRTSGQANAGLRTARKSQLDKRGPTSRSARHVIAEARGRPAWVASSRLSGENAAAAWRNARPPCVASCMMFFQRAAVPRARRFDVR